MNSITENNFNAKILLFGEYSLLYGSMALSIPFGHYQGSFDWMDKSPDKKLSKISNQQISKFFNYISEIVKAEKLNFPLDTERLKRDIETGLYFKSNIPKGYGLGSSGALVAALFDKYSLRARPSDSLVSVELLKLKKNFALLESYFHGQSSGLDPLISYLNKPVLVSGKKEVKSIVLKWKSFDGPGAVFLIDSGTSGETQPLVNRFRENYKDYSYRKLINESFIPIVNNSIESYINTDREKLIFHTRQISGFQARYFKEMIPESIKKVWQNGFETNTFSLKLCGSGGGGMMLGFTSDIEVAKKHLHGFAPTIIHHI